MKMQRKMMTDSGGRSDKGDEGNSEANEGVNRDKGPKKKRIIRERQRKGGGGDNRIEILKGGVKNNFRYRS